WKCLLEKYKKENVISYLQQQKCLQLLRLKAIAKIKRLIFNSNTTLLELAEKLSVYILEEDKKTEYALFRASIPKTVLTATANTILPNICKMLRKYLTAELLKIQEDQIKQALQYHAVDLNLFGENPNFTDIMTKSMLELVDKDKIVEMWGI
ncbi:7176_t:CDS:2, partial [Gigaspora rosea]